MSLRKLFFIVTSEYSDDLQKASYGVLLFRHYGVLQSTPICQSGTQLLSVHFYCICYIVLFIFFNFFYMYIGHNDIERYCKTVIIICIHLCRNFIQFVKVTRFFKYMYMIFNFGQSVKTKLLKLSRQNSRAAFFLSSYVQHNFITKLLQTTYLLLEPIVKKT